MGKIEIVALCSKGHKLEGCNSHVIFVPVLRHDIGSVERFQGSHPYQKHHRDFSLAAARLRRNDKVKETFPFLSLRGAR